MVKARVPLERDSLDNMENEGIFARQLAPGQWNAIRRLVGDVSGATIYGYVESWDGLGRYARTKVMDFGLMD